MVTVSSVEIHQSGTTTTQDQSTTTSTESGWIPMQLSGSNTFDLLQIKGLEEVLATGDLAPGTYTQIRMEVSKVTVTLAGEQPQDAKLPSGKLKFVQPFDVAAGKTTVLLFDFDAGKSVNVAGNKQPIFKPVIKLNVTKTPGNMEITTSGLPNGELGKLYDETTLSAMGGKTPYTWSIDSGNLPAGLTLAPTTGIISGIPITTAGDFTFTVKVVDSSTSQKSATKTFTVNIAVENALQITTTTLTGGTVGTLYTSIVKAVGGTGTYSWTILSGGLPDGLLLNATTGEISGTPTAKGKSDFVIQVTDSANPANTDNQSLSISIYEAVSA
jgi:hypothetical protein